MLVNGENWLRLEVVPPDEMSFLLCACRAGITSTDPWKRLQVLNLQRSSFRIQRILLFLWAFFTSMQAEICFQSYTLNSICMFGHTPKFGAPNLGLDFSISRSYSVTNINQTTAERNEFHAPAGDLEEEW